MVEASHLASTQIARPDEEGDGSTDDAGEGA
jgi:hypothetical protein